MCLGVPGELVEVRHRDGLRVGTVRFGEMRREVSLEPVSDAVLGDWVLVHVGFAIARLDREDAERTLRWLEELREMEPPPPPPPWDESS